MPAALIISHGQPSDPAPAEAEIAALAARVQALMPDWHVASATLATEGALAEAVARAVQVGAASGEAAGGEAAAGEAAGGFAYPLFMADGWFTRDHLPKRLAEAGGGAWQVLDPFGIDDAVQRLTVTLAHEAAAATGVAPADAELLLAAHGSFRSPAPAKVANAMAARIAASGFGRVEAAFIDQSPRIAEAAAGFSEGALVLPFFAAKGGHVVDDLPEALHEAGFRGRLLEPVGLDPRVPSLIADALRRAAAQATLSISAT
ncbi:sirohydrochlorin chelatase [Paragemmobacter straminiformis]|uniref:Cobalamin biosynthesis protein CbiX n=1 Tax=Paragemmobacter straminiformis TaxID=2045119 RepID=A0A842I442_9RHOB|nr:CbiX/SirB N-terminal domain-containing protein [Gemmobacter straminiformis]MBC2834409.1 cobalamin biosynthesis protein CbiX [Gemmobacter straminiformis]